ncbi:hypothetical protein C6503_25635 [Candidatus Poribacteria bacterium]|nr:MAG: hypothetical protein C6503_25635 [Candidatus Poribacteria bacterium]
MNKQQKGPRRHHWRPQWYLNGFSIPDNPERCHALNVVSGQAIYNSHIKNLAVEKDFYRFSDDFAGIEPQVSQFDGVVSSIFSEIVSENQMTFSSQHEYEYKTEMMLRFIAYMMAFDPAVRDSIIHAAKFIAPEDITDKDDVEPIPLHIAFYLEYLGIIRNMGSKIGFKTFTASDDNFFICPDIINFTATYDNELHLCFPVHKNLCFYGCSSKEVLDTLNPSVPQINTMLLLHSRQFVYFPSWDLKIDNGISEIPIKDLKNKGIDEIIEIWLQKKPTIINPFNTDLIFHIIEKHIPDDARKEASDYIEKTISDIKSDIYAMYIVHDENYDGRSPLSLDKFKEITLEVSQLTSVNIKHFLSKGMATVFFRMHESNDGSSMTLRVAKRDDINTAEDALNAQIVCNIMPIDQWVDAVVTSKIYDNEGVRIATEMAGSVKCPIYAEQAHTFLSEFVSHTQMELNDIRDLARQGQATPDMNTPYSMLFMPESKEGGSVENCSMSDIANKIDSLIQAQWIDTITDSMGLNEIFQSDELLIPHSDNNLLLFSSWDEKIENLCISKAKKSGATFSIWLHIFNLCLSTPRFLVFVAMKEYSTLLETIIDDLEQVILGYKLSNSMPTISLIGKPSRPEGIRFPNGSEIKFLGLRGKNGLRSKKTAEKIEKESPQLFWLSDASELYDFDIWNPIHRILLSQNKQCQIILEAYPKSPQHWIYKLFHSDEPGILNLHEGRDIAISDTIDKCSSMMWLDFKLDDNPVMVQFYDERERKDIAIKLLKHIQIDKAEE